ncbi:hypothetical protein Tco_0515352 [Tanacetum coccineum]
MNMFNRNCRTSFVKPEFLKKAQRTNPCLYDPGCYNDNLALMLAPESDEMIQEMVADLRYFNSLEHEVDSLKSQLETQKTPFLNEIDRLSREYYYADHMKAILGVIPTTSVSRPQLKSNRLEDRVMHNDSQGKKQQVEDHRRNFKFSNNKTSVTACNDSLNAKTSNVNFICVTCGKCMLNGNHDMCVLHHLNGMNSRTKQPIAMPISTREPKRTMNQSVATPLRRTVASESTNQKPRSTIRKLYEHVSKSCSWWYPKFTPSGYKWKPKSPIGNVNTNVNMPLGNESRTADILETMTPRYFSFGRQLEDLHVTWAHLEKKRTRLRTNTKTLEDLCSQSLETTSQAIHDAVTTHKVTASQHFKKASARTESHADLEDSTHDGNANPSSNLESLSQESLDTTHTKFTARISKLLAMRQTIDSLLFKTINKMTNQSSDSEIFCPDERIKELELRTQ